LSTSHHTAPRHAITLLQTEAPDSHAAAVALLRLLRLHPVGRLTPDAASGVVWALGAMAKKLGETKDAVVPEDLRHEVG
jgi:hypothetical protein